MNVSIIFSHPVFSDSVANKKIINSIQSKSNNIHIRHLDALYTPGNIDVEIEQETLLASDVIVLQFPLYWYTVPGMMKYWLDKVMVYQFAFGSQGDKLKNKSLIISLTAGATEEKYNNSGGTIDSYCLWSYQLGKLAQMNYKGVVASYGYGLEASREYVDSQTAQHVENLYTRIYNK